MKQDLADFKPVEGAVFQNGDDRHHGGFEALRLVRFVARGVFRFWRSDRMVVFVWGEGFCRPCRGWVFMGGMEPSAHALGYHLTVLRAWGHGLGRPEVEAIAG